MYTAYIGKRIVDIYNQGRPDNEVLSIRNFFDEVFFPIFFDDERYLLLANNSSFDQAYKQRAKRPLTAEIRREALMTMHSKVEKATVFDGSILLGGPAADHLASTSGQTTSITAPLSSDDVYASWIGAVAGIGVKGGVSLLIDMPEILTAIVDGWLLYRTLMSRTPNLKPYQIDTWNGRWIVHRFSQRYKSDDPFFGFNLGLNIPKGEPNAALTVQPWIDVLFALAKAYPAQRLNAYVYSFGQMNTTIGFIPLDLPKVTVLINLYNRLFGNPANLNRQALDGLYQTENGFHRACQQGAIGLRAMEPKGLRQYMTAQSNKPVKLLKPASKEEEQISYNIYLTWIVAMLNNETLLSLAETTAKALHRFSQSGERKKTDRKRMVEQGLSSGSRRKFIDCLTEIIAVDPTYAEEFNNLVVNMMKMPAMDFPLLSTLIKFNYTIANAQ